MNDSDDSQAADAQTQDTTTVRAQRHRHVIRVVSNREAPIAVTDIAEAIASRESGTDGGPADRYVGVASLLHHVHLPKLSEAGLVEYDPDRNLVTSVQVEGPTDFGT